jgi:hypothetical protein
VATIQIPASIASTLRRAIQGSDWGATANPVATQLVVRRVTTTRAGVRGQAL